MNESEEREYIQKKEKRIFQVINNINAADRKKAVLAKRKSSAFLLFFFINLKWSQEQCTVEQKMTKTANRRELSQGRDGP